MKKPSLRFRQVFEHPTHFKIVKPLGNPIVVAKKGLSPSMLGRLRAFAQGGEVKGYQAGGEVTPEVMTAESRPPPEPVIPLEVMTAESRVAPSSVSTSAPTAAPAISAKPVLAASPSGPEPFAPLPPMLPEPSAVTAADTALLQRPPQTIIEAPEEAATKLAAEAKAVELPFVEPAKTLEDQLKRQVVASEAQATAIESKPATADLKERVQREATINISRAEAQAAREQLDALEREKMLKDQVAKYEADKARYEQVSAENRNIMKQASDDLEKMRGMGSYFSRLSTPQQIGTAVSLAMGAFATGLSGVPNVAQRIYENAVEKDIERQREDSRSLLNRLTQAGNSQQQAEQMIRSIADNTMATNLQIQAAKTSSVKARDAANTAAAMFRANAENRMMMIDRDLRDEAQQKFQRGVTLEELRLKKEASARQDVAQLLEAQRLKTDEAKVAAQIAKETREAATEREGKMFQVGPVAVAANDKTVARKAQEQILGQTDFVEGAERTLGILKENPRMSFIPFTDANQTLKLALAQMLERYPKSERFGRPLNVTASKVIKGGLPPEKGAEAILNSVFGNPVLVISELVKDAKSVRDAAIEYYGGSDPEGVERAKQYLLQRESGTGFTPIAKEK